jgi:hypothetical protein
VSEAGFRCASRADHAHAQKRLDSSAKWAVEPGPSPQLPSDHDRINHVRFPPRGLVSVPMELSMVTPAQRDGEFVANPAAEGAQLGKSQMVCIRRPPPADEARLRRHEPEVRAVAVAAGFAQCKRTFVDVPGNGIPHPLFAGRPQFMRARWGWSRLAGRCADLNTCSQSGHQGSSPWRLGRVLRQGVASARSVIGGRAGFRRARARQYRHSGRKFCLDAGGVRFSSAYSSRQVSVAPMP